MITTPVDQPHYLIYARDDTERGVKKQPLVCGNAQP
jgi:hypothetical protein